MTSARPAATSPLRHLPLRATAAPADRRRRHEEALFITVQDDADAGDEPERIEEGAGLRRQGVPHRRALLVAARAKSFTVRMLV